MQLIIPEKVALPLDAIVAAVPTFNPARKFACVEVIILSVDATPVKPSPLPTNVVAVTIPEKVAFPLAAIVAAVPTFTAVTVMVGSPVNPEEVPEAFPVTSPVKGPVNLEAVTIPANVALPLFDMVAAVPTSNPFAVTTPTKSESPEDVRVTPVPIRTFSSLPSIVTDPDPIVTVSYTHLTLPTKA